MKLSFDMICQNPVNLWGSYFFQIGIAKSQQSRPSKNANQTVKTTVKNQMIQR